MLCPDCGHDNVPGVDLCESCGSDLAGFDLEAGEGFRGHLLSGELHELQPAEPLRVGPEATVLEAIDLMREKRHGCVLVTEGERLVGIFTERDVLVRVLRPHRDPATTRIVDVMTADPFTLQIDDPPVFAVHRMVSQRFRHIPVLAGEKLRGFVSVRNVLRFVHETVLGESAEPAVSTVVARLPEKPTSDQGAPTDEPLSLFELLGELGEIRLEGRREDATMLVALASASGGRRLVLLERTYRTGIKVIVDPSEAELKLAREGDGWALWGSDRARLLSSAL